MCGLAKNSASTDNKTHGNATTISGGINPTGFTQGSVAFAGVGGTLTQDNPTVFWDDTNNRLGIGTTAPTAKLQIDSSDYGQLVLRSTAVGGTNDIEFMDGNLGTYPVQIFANTAQGFQLWTNGHGSLLVNPNGLVTLNYNGGTQGGILLRATTSQSFNMTSL